MSGSRLLLLLSSRRRSRPRSRGSPRCDSDRPLSAVREERGGDVVASRRRFGDCVAPRFLDMWAEPELWLCLGMSVLVPGVELGVVGDRGVGLPPVDSPSGS